MSFLYFVETEQFQGTVEDVAKAGLSYAFESPPQVRSASQGPGGKSGFVVSCDDDLGYYKERQTWRRSGVDGLWVGQWTGRELGPGDLFRRRPLPGHMVTLADDRVWLCPTARKLTDSADGPLQWSNALPHRWGVDDAGHWVTGAILPRYAALWEEVAWIWEYFKTSDGQTTVDGQKAGHAAALALAANYRLGPVECDMLGLIDDQTVFEVLGALVDWPSVIEWGKKKRNSVPASST